MTLDPKPKPNPDLGPNPHLRPQASNFCNTKGTSQVCEQGDCPDSDCVACCKVVDPDNRYDFPPYAIHNGFGNLGGKTIPMSAYHVDGTREYDVHNLFGMLESRCVQWASRATA